MKRIYTIGHSTRPIEEFLRMLEAHGIKELADVRTIPRSRHNPQFGEEALSASLQERGVGYRRFAGLGGLRRARKDSPNTAWRNASFRGYADYMMTSEFSVALEELEGVAEGQPTAVMCAEALPWRCHRSLIADALYLRGWEVRHIMSEKDAPAHQPTPFMQAREGRPRYPGPEGRLF